MEKENVVLDKEMASKLERKVKEYHKHDLAEKAAKKLKTPLNKELKELMSSIDLREFETEDLVATYKVQERTNMDEVKLLNRLKELGLDKAIETVERPNQEALTAMFYSGELDPEAIADCMVIKEVEVLSVRQKKKKRGTK